MSWSAPGPDDESTNPPAPPPAKQDDASPVQPVELGFVDVMVFAAIAAWLAVGLVAVIQWADYSEQRDSFGISAPQVSQIADEFKATMIPWIVIAVGVTAITILLIVRRQLVETIRAARS